MTARQNLLFLIAAASSLLLADLGVEWSVSSQLAKPMETNSPATLFSKTKTLATDKGGARIAIIGDSLVYGRLLEEHGFDDWKNSTLDAQLGHLQKSRRSAATFHNFGMNGITPADAEIIINNIADSNPDAILMDITLRSFSMDFSGSDNVNTRKWLGDFHVINGRLASPGDNNLASRFSYWLINNSALYRNREIIQDLTLGSTPSDISKRAARAVNDHFSTSKDKRTPDELMLQLLAKQRYASIKLGKDNPQWQAFTRILEIAKAKQIPIIFFYATENPEVLPNLIDESKYKDMIDTLATTIKMANSNYLSFVPPLDELKEEHFLDHVHLTPEGYRILAARLSDAINKLPRPDKGHHDEPRNHLR